MGVDFLVYGDLNTIFLSGGSGLSYGGGVFYQLPEGIILSSLDFAIKGHYRKFSVKDVGDDDANNNAFGISYLYDLDQSEMGVNLVTSPQEGVSEMNVFWYGTIGIDRISTTINNAFSDGDYSVSTTNVVFGGGVVLPLAMGDAYAGLVFNDSAIFQAGFRYPLNF